MSHPVSGPLSGKVALVTGSGRGIGAAIALKLAKEGADLVVNDISADAAREVANQIEKLGRRTLVSQHDVSDHSQAMALADEAMAKLGRLDVLVNNAGITRDGMLHKLAEEKWDEVIRVNLKGPYNMGQACGKKMMEQKSGRIINICSVAMLGNIGQTNYSASKAGLLGMTRTWALELARYGITSNAVAPGFIDTAMTQAMPPEIREKFIQKIPLKRMGSTEDIADAVLYFALPGSSYVTGQVLMVDGGLTSGLGGI